ncbi:MAG: cytochrome c3 family protein [Crocinitomicaceae bacterium]|nr:cytochrome c3 family protein [Crocinitomicaceae bacterium]
MKISSSQMFRNFNKWCLSAITVLFLGGTFTAQAQGGDLFSAKCATCHTVFKDLTGPKLFEVRDKWESGSAVDGSIIQWVQNWQAAAANDPYAQEVSNFSPTAMTPFPELTEEQIISIFDWIDAQEPVVAKVAEGPDAVQEEESSMGWIYIILGVVFLVIILAVGGVRRQLKAATAEVDGDSFNEGMSYSEELKQWAWLNRRYVGIGGLITVIGVVVVLFLGLYTINIVEGYQPSQPIQFPHSVHAGTNGIDCMYCHNSADRSKTAGLPTVNVCMNCHKQITGAGDQIAKIEQIYQAAGWDPSGAGKYTNETQEIIWNKVHVLPDHVYFNHSQHVTVGGIDCKQCHGDMTTMTETAMVQPIEALNAVEGNIQLTRKTLTMGWCIECHQEAGISEGPLDGLGDGYYDEIHKRLRDGDQALYNEYLEDGKVSVKELGGWECAKCHY